jgi:hypothetical protein
VVANGLKQVRKITKVTIRNCPSLKDASIIDFTDNRELRIINCPELEVIYCSKNQLTKFDLISCPRVARIVCNINMLTSLNFLNNLESERLVYLDISNNNFCTDLEPFRRFVNLKFLAIGNKGWSRNEKENIYNLFYGSLEPLRNLNKLEFLSINDTDIDSGVEYLPNSIRCV